MQYTSPMHTYLLQTFLEAPILVPKEYNLLYLKINCLRVRDIKVLGTREKLNEYTASMAKPIDVYSFFWISIGVWGI